MSLTLSLQWECIGAIWNVSARCRCGTRRHHCSKVLGWGWSSREEEKRGIKQALLLLLCPWLPTAVFRSPSILTVFLGYLADAILSSTHQHLFCFQCQSLGMISVCRSLWIVGINRGGEARRALFLWTLFGKRNVIPVAFPAVTFPTYNHDICQETLETVAKPPVRVLTAHVMCLLACGCRWFCV